MTAQASSTRKVTRDVSTAALAPVRWVSVARDANWSTSMSRHLVRKGADTSFCGTTALPASIWRGNTTKAICPTCAARAKERGVDLPAPAV